MSPNTTPIAASVKEGILPLVCFWPLISIGRRMFDCEYSGLLIDMGLLRDVTVSSDHEKYINRINNHEIANLYPMPSSVNKYSG